MRNQYSTFGKILLVLLLSIGSILANAQSSATLQPNLTGLCVGDVVIVPVKITGTAVLNMSFYLDFDRSVLKDPTLSALPYYQNVKSGWSPVVNWDFVPGTTQSIDVYAPTSVGVDFADEVILELVYIYNGGTTNIHIRTAPDALPLSGIWNDIGNPLTPYTFTDNSVTGSYAVAAAGPISGTSILCQGTTGVVYSVGAITNAVGYAWTLPPGATIASGANSNSITVNYSGSSTSGNVTVQGINNAPCPSGAISTFPVTVNPNATIALSSPAGTNAQTVCISTPITNITYAIGGGGVGAGVTGLPTGVTGSYAAGVFTISGTPSVAGTYNYTVTTTGICTQTTATGSITVTPNSTIAMTSAAGTNLQTLCINNAITNITYSVGGSATGATVTGLPTGVTGAFASGVFTISGTPSVAGTFNYTVTTTGPCVQATATGTITVIANSTIALTSAAGTNLQTLCINNAITNITYSVGGSGTGATVTGLPTGVTGAFASGVFTISGTPSVAGTFNYTVTTTGPCLQATATGTITVIANSTIALTSAAGTNLQTLCINNAITSITYSVGGSATGATVTGLPTGVTGVYVSGVFTISGTPSVAGTFNYTVTTTGPCVQATATGTITVTPNSTITLTSAAGTNLQTLCINNAITNITYSVGGSGTGATVTGLPTGVTGAFASGVFTISGTPSVAGTFNYTVTTTGPCVQATATGTITVIANSTIALTSAAGTNLQTLCINNAITSITYSVGGSATGATVTGLPTGVTGVYVSGVFTISGTPSVAGTFNYTVTTTGPCVQATASGTITVTPNSTITLTSAAGTNLQTLCINNAITNITYSVGGSGTGATVTGLPTGVTGAFASGVFTISGTPSIAGTFNYTVTTTGPCVQATATGTITVIANSTIALTSAAGTNLQTLCINNAITSITYSVGGSATGATVTGLPTGVTGVYVSGVFTISGTPSVAGTFNYTVTTTGPCVQATATGTITVTPNSTITLTSTAGTNLQTLCINNAITNITYSVGGSGTGATVTGLPTGVTGAFASGVFTISGTPSVAGTFTYTVTTTGPCLQATATGTITVTPNSTITLTSVTGTNAQTLCINNAITNITYSVGGSATGATVTGLPTGVTGAFASGVFTISGTPSVAGTFNYTVTTTGPCVQATATGTITVIANSTIALTSAAGTNLQTLCINNAITNITYSVGGSATGATVTGLPTGVTGVYVSGVFTISGTPSVAGTFNYTVTTTGPCVQATATGTITVTPNSTITLTSAAGTNLQTLCINNAITSITYSVGGSATGATVTGLPTGVTGVYASGVFTISGTPSVAGTFNYTVTTTGPCVQATATGTITVTPNSTITLTSAVGTNLQTLCINNAITNITYSVGGSGTGATVTGLPTGVTGVYVSGVFTISGTPSVAGTFNYTITTTGPCAQATATGTITVTANSTITLTSVTGTNAQTLCINNAITNITYSVGGSATGATVTGLPTGVTGAFASGVFTISGTPSVAGTFNYTVTTTGPCVQATATGTITVIANSTIALTSAAGTNLQTLCINNAITNITYSVGGSGTGATVTGLPTGVTGVYVSGVFTISGTPSVAGTFNYTVTTTGPCVQATATGTITVTPNSTITLTSAAGTNLQTLCINNTITSITYSVGGSATGATVTGLPTGVTGVYASGVFTISGTPSVAGTFNYTVTTTGPCVQATATGTITVNPNATIALTSATGTNLQTLCINNAITNITYAVGGGGTGATVTGLPTGVTGVFASGVFTISGTPTVAGTFNYTVTTTGTCLQATATGTITVNSNATVTLTSAAGTTAQTLCVNTNIANITYSVGGSATGAVATGLPAGVSGVFASGVFTISGAPSVAGTFNYTVTTTGPCIQASLGGTITVNPNQTLTLTSAAGTNAQTVCINTPIATITYAVGGGGTGAGVTGLPTGVTGNYSAGVFTISGTPTVSGVFSYTIITSGTCAQASASGTITISPNSTITLTSAAGTIAQTLCVNTAITNITYAVGGSGTGATVTGLPSGVTGAFASGVFTISGTPSVAGTFNYTVTTTGPCVQATATGTITVNPNATITLTSAAGTNVQSLCINTAITTIAYSIGGGGTGATVAGLPTGVTGVFASGVFTISGTPTVSGTFNYTVTTTGTCVQATATGTITVNPNATISLTSAAGTDAQSKCVNTAITNITYAIGGGGTGAGVTGLPAGVTGAFAAGVFTISGTPTVTGTFPYTVTTTGTCVQATATGTITVNPNATITLTSAAGTNVQIRCINTAITNITYSVGGGGTGAGVTGLPAGVTGTYAAGVFTISGTPTVTGTFNYTVTTTGTCVQATATGTITVNPRPVPTITGPATVCAVSTGNVYTTEAGMTGYTWVLSAGGTITAGGGTNAITVTWNTAGAQTVSVNYANANGCTATTATVFNVTANAMPAPTITGPATACVGSTGNVYTTQTGMTAYTWTVSAGGTITAGAGTSSITVTWTTAGARTVSVNYTNASSCTALTPAVYNVTVNSGPAPTITGPASVCAGATGVVYTTEAGFTNYQWTISYDGVITSGLNTNQVTVTWATSGSRYITANYTNPSGCSALTPTYKYVDVLLVPVPMIFGETAVCQGATDVVYTTQAGNANYVWNVSAGGTITAGAGTASIKVTWNAGGNQTVSVNYTNSLGCPGAQPTVYNVTVAPLPAAAAAITGPANVCSGSQGVIYTVPVVANATTYAWTVPAGATIALGATTNSITVNFSASAASGIIKVNGVNTCGNGASSPNFNVTVNPIPATPVITQVPVGDTLISSAATGNQWYLNGVAIPGATGKKYKPVYLGSYTVVVTLNGCSSLPSNTIVVTKIVATLDLEVSHSFEVYPNPSHGQFNIKVVSGKPIELSIEIYNNVGSLQWKQEKVQIDGTYITPVDLGSVPAGVYMVALRNKEINMVRKVVIMK